MGQWQRQLVVGATGERGDGRSTPPANVTGTSTGSGTAAAALRQGWWPLAAGRWPLGASRNGDSNLAICLCAPLVLREAPL